MTTAEIPEVGGTFVGPRGTRHRITQLFDNWVKTPCAGGVMRDVLACGPYPYRRACRICFPDQPEDFGSDTLTDLERARTVAVDLEQDNAALLIRIANARARLTGAMYRGEISEDLRARITAELAGDEVQP